MIKSIFFIGLFLVASYYGLRYLPEPAKDKLATWGGVDKLTLTNVAERKKQIIKELDDNLNVANAIITPENTEETDPLIADSKKLINELAELGSQKGLFPQILQKGLKQDTSTSTLVDYKKLSPELKAEICSPSQTN